jgi:hypothetical protein
MRLADLVPLLLLLKQSMEQARPTIRTESAHKTLSSCRVLECKADLLESAAYRRLTRALITVNFSPKVKIAVHRSRIVPLFVIFFLLVTSIVYACSGLALAQMISMSATMNHSATEGKPCNSHKLDICKSLRYQMLSVRPSLVVSEITVYLSTTLYSAHYDVPLLTSLIRGAGPPGIMFPSTSEVSFPFSSQVLRI